MTLITTFVVFVIRKDNKKKLENEKKEKLKEKEHEVESLRLENENEKLKQKLEKITTPKFFYCKYCGSKNDASAKRCFKCGVGIEER